MEYLLFGKFLVTNAFIGPASNLNSIRAAFNLSVEERKSIYQKTTGYKNNNNNSSGVNNNSSFTDNESHNSTQKEKNDNLPFALPDIVIINAGLWDSRAAPNSYSNTMGLWRKLLENDLKMPPDNLYWRSTTPVHPQLHLTDKTRINMTLEKIQQLNSIAHHELVEIGGWHYINGYGSVSEDPSSLQQAALTISGDGFHPSGLSLCKMMDIIFGSLCQEELTQDNDKEY